MNDDKNQPAGESLGPIEYSTEVTESTGDHHYRDATDPLEVPIVIVAPKEQKALALFGLILALPFPILVIVLWLTIDGIKDQNAGFSNNTMNAVFLYLLQFFLIPVLSIGSLIIASIVTMKSHPISKKIGYISFAVTGVGFIILGLFLNHS